MEKYVVNTAGVAAESFGNEVVLINLLKGNYYSFRDAAAIAIWKAIELGATKAHIDGTLAAMFDSVDANAVEHFLAQLLQENLILAVPNSVASHESLPEVASKQPFSPPMLEVYDDLQAMIMLDPVHDVDAMKGWPHQKDADDSAK